MAKEPKIIPITQTADADQIARLMADQLKIGTPTEPSQGEPFEPHITAAAEPQLGRRSREIPKPRPRPLTFD